MEMASAVQLNALCHGLKRLRRANARPCAAIARVAGAAPNSSAVAIQKVSSMPMVASTDEGFSRYQPEMTASESSVSHTSGCGRRTTTSAACVSTTTPANTTVRRYTGNAERERPAVRAFIEPAISDLPPSSTSPT